MKSCEHVVQFYGRDEKSLALSVAAYLSESLRAGGAALVIAESSRRAAILGELQRLGCCRSEESGLRLLDDSETLECFMRDGRPDARLFDSFAGGLAADLLARFGRLRAYGEMVGRLWTQRAYDAAIELEELWNRLLERSGFELYCGYPIDVFSDDFQLPTMRPVLAKHTRVLTALKPSFEDAMRRAMVEVLGDRPRGFDARDGAERAILRLRSALPRYADTILAKAKEYTR